MSFAAVIPMHVIEPVCEIRRFIINERLHTSRLSEQPMQSLLPEYLTGFFGSPRPCIYPQEYYIILCPPNPKQLQLQQI